MARGFVLGVVAAVVALLVCFYLAIKIGAIPANADSRPSKLERWIASNSLHAAMAREAPRGPNPMALNDANLAAGIKIYAENCAVCHGGADGRPSNIAHGLYQHPPQLAKDGVEDDPEGITYWKVYHGIRLTGMPSFGHSLADQQIWQVTLFLKHMDALPLEAARLWKTVGVTGSGSPPRSPSAKR